jgi:hypothetical protein
MFFSNNFFARMVQFRQSVRLSQKLTIFFVAIALVGTILIGDFSLRNCYAGESSTNNAPDTALEKIAPLVNDLTFVIAYINLTEIDLKLLRKELTKFISRASEISEIDKKLKGRILSAGEKLFNEIFPVADNFITDLTVQAGLSELYFVGTLFN